MRLLNLLIMLLTVFVQVSWSTSASACNILIKRDVDALGVIIRIGIDQGRNTSRPCRKEYFAEFYNSLSQESDRHFYRELIKKFFTEGTRGSWAAFYSSVGGIETPRRERFESVRLDREPRRPSMTSGNEPSEPLPPPPPTPGPDFDGIWGITYEKSKLHTPVEIPSMTLPAPTPTADDSLLSAHTIGELVSKGFIVMELARTGALTEIGQAFEMTLSSLVYQKEIPDWVSALNRRALIQEAYGQLDDFRREMVASYQRTLTNVASLKLANDVNMLTIGDDLNVAAQTIGDAKKRLADHANQIDRAAAVLTTIRNVKLAELSRPNIELAELRAGMLPDAALSELDARIHDELDRFAATGSLASFNATVAQARTDTNPLRRVQLDGVLRRFTDDEGIVSAWRHAYPDLSQTRLRTDPGSDSGETIRANLNEALGYLATGTHAGNQKATQQLVLSIGMLAESDQNMASGDTLHGYRLLNRARTLLDFATTNPRLVQYGAYRVSQAARSKFGIDGDGSSFEGYELLSIANRLARETQIETNPQLHFLATTSLQQADALQKSGRTVEFLRNIDIAWAAFDYAKGVGKGVVDFAYDFATGIYQLVRHPADSAQAIYVAVVNYDRTYEVIAHKVEEVIDSYPTMSNEEKGRLHGRLALELGSMLIGVGAIRGSGATGEIATGIARATESLTPLMVQGLEFGFQSAKDIKELISSKVVKIPRIFDSAKNIGFKTGEEIKQNVGIIERWGSAFKSKSIDDSSVINRLLANDGYTNPPYMTGTNVVSFTSESSESFVRVHNGIAPGRWVMKKSDIQGLTALQIKEKFALPNIPTHISDVSVPAGTNMRVGITAPNFGHAGGSTQFEITERIAESSFGIGKVIEGVIQ